MSESRSPARARTLRIAGAGPKPMMRGATPTVAVAITCALGFKSYLRAASADASSNAHAPACRRSKQPRPAAVVDARGIARGDGPIGFDDCLELGERFERCLARVLIAADGHCVALILPDSHRDDA